MVFPHYSHGVRSRIGSDAWQTATNLFNRRLHISIREGEAGQTRLGWTLRALDHLGPFPVGGAGWLGFLWIAEILTSGYPEDGRVWMTGKVLQLLGKYFFSKVSEQFRIVQRAWILLLLGFLSRSEKFYTMDFPLFPRYVALRILSTSPGYGDFGPKILPVLTDTAANPPSTIALPGSGGLH